MTRASVLKIVNPILGVLLLNQVATGLLHGVLPYEAFEVLHEWSGILLVVVVIVHVILNWNWIKTNFFRKEPPIKA